MQSLETIQIVELKKDDFNKFNIKTQHLNIDDPLFYYLIAKSDTQVFQIGWIFYEQKFSRGGKYCCRAYIQIFNEENRIEILKQMLDKMQQQCKDKAYKLILTGNIDLSELGFKTEYIYMTK